MADPADELGLDQQERIEIAEQVERGGQISEVLSDFVEKIKDSSALEHVSKLLPWLGHSVEIAGEALPPIKAVAKALEKTTEIKDPLDLGMIACSTAYGQACAEAFSIARRPAASIAFYSDDAISQTKSRLKKELAAMEARNAQVLENFSLQSALTHRFTKTADLAFLAVSEHFGYDPQERRHLQAIVHQRFVSNLKVLLTSGGKDKDRFRNFRELIQLQSDSVRNLVYENASEQVRSFSESPVLQVEPFTLADVYLEPECGILPVERIKEPNVDPFDDTPEAGGRVSLLEAVLDKIGDGQFQDVIVIQGPPGSGKSTFTLRLCAELLEQGLCPVRARMRDLPVERPPGGRRRGSEGR